MSKRATLKDIAEEAGVSTAVVSAVVNQKENQSIFVGEEKKKQVLDLVDKYNYIPHRQARALSRQKAGTIGIIVQRLTPYFSSLLEKLQEMAFEEDIEIMPYITDDRPEKEEDLLRKLSDGRVDGVIITGGTMGSPDRYDRYVHSPFNLKIVTTFDPGHGIPSVGPDEEKIGRLVADHLIECGCEHLWALSSENGRGRSHAFIDRVREKGASVDLIEVESFTFGGCYRNGQPIVQESIKKQGKPDGIFAYNDLIGIAAIKQLQSIGLNIPNEVKVVSCDNTEICQYTHPELTSVDYNVPKMAFLLLKKLSGLVDGRKLQEQRTKLLPELVVRGSTVQDVETDRRAENAEAVIQV
jgi:LacI family transcriptional regulator/LacI family sucrose operon transcriptional repressor